MTTVPVLVFASASDVVSCGDAPTGGLSALTVEGWFRVLTIAGGNRPLLAKYGAGGHEWALYVTSDGRVYFAVYHASEVSVGYTAAGVVTHGPWVHVAGCYDAGGGHVKVWIDGVDRTQSSRPAAGALAVADTPQALQIGGVLGDAAWPFVGRAGWQRVSNVCRYPGTLRMPDGYPAVDGQTLGQWNLSEGAGSAVDNAEGTAAYDGAISGAVWGVSVVDDKRLARPVVVRPYGYSWARPIFVG